MNKTMYVAIVFKESKINKLDNVINIEVDDTWIYLNCTDCELCINKDSVLSFTIFKDDYDNS